MFLVQFSLLIATFLSLISQNLSLKQTTQEVNPHPCIAPCINMWSVTFLFFHLLNVGACICHIINMLHFVLFRSVTCYTNSIVSRIHVNTTKLYNIMCTLVVTCVILRSLECIRWCKYFPCRKIEIKEDWFFYLFFVILFLKVKP